MNKGNLIATGMAFGLGSIAGNYWCKENVKRMARNEKLALHMPTSTEEITQRVPKAMVAAAKELVDPRTIDLRTGKEITKTETRNV